MKAAKFPARKSLEDFDFTHATSFKRDQIAHLGTPDFITARENVVFLGPPGTGKTQLATGLAIKACRAGHRVEFATAHHSDIVHIKGGSYRLKDRDLGRTPPANKNDYLNGGGPFSTGVERDRAAPSVQGVFLVPGELSRFPIAPSKETRAHRRRAVDWSEFVG